MAAHPAKARPDVPPRHSGQSREALAFFALAGLGVAIATGISVALGASFQPVRRSDFFFPAAFGVTTCLLATGSVLLQLAVRAVRQEQQRRFRRLLCAAGVCGILFIGVQSYGLWNLLPEDRTAGEASTGVTAFVVALSALHALHFSVAVLFVLFVIVRAISGRYDHEYAWGVRICTWFWHALGLVWLAILAIFAIAL